MSSEKPKVDFSSVIIEKEKVEVIKAAISQLDYHELIFNEWGFGEIFEKGTAVSLLFYGIPGTGKTLMAQAIADMMGMELAIIATADIETSEPGGAERAIRKHFEYARQKNKEHRDRVKSYGKEYVQQNYNSPDYRPIVLLFDECDSLLMDRNSIGVIMAAQVNALLSEIENYEGVIIFTTNRLGKLDQALERRISAKIEFTFPDKTQRELIWRRMFPKQAPLAKDVRFTELAEYPMAGGNIKNAVLNAARYAAYRQYKNITKACVIDAVEKELIALREFLSNKIEDQKNEFKGLVRTPSGVAVASTSTNKVKGVDTTITDEIDMYINNIKEGNKSEN